MHVVLLPRGQIFYDASCGVCSEGYRKFGPMTERRGFSWAPLQDVRVREFLGLEGDELPPEMKLLTRKGRLLGGMDAIAFVCKYIWWARPIWILNRIPGIHELMALGYRWFAKHRRQISGACGYDPSKPSAVKHAA
jgi:predicted DCC family thiol-disulfide oxidoreductase YuxK